MMGRHGAAWWLATLHERLSHLSVAPPLQEREIKDLARAIAHRCRIAMAACTDKLVVTTARRVLKEQEVPFPPVGTAEGLRRRLGDEGWWRPKLRRVQVRRWEEVAYALGRVNRHRQIYASDETVTRRIEQKAQIRDLLEALSAVKELGDTFTLAELCEHSVSNPANRRAELMARIAGQEQLAKQLGYGADFLTITCPSRMHASLSRPGDANPNYDGTLPDGAQAYLSRVWARIRAKAKRDALPMFGMWVAEPQHDGTPHWHLLVFFPPDDRKRLRGLFSHYALETDGNEPGAHKHRFVAEEIDPLKGTAIGYLEMDPGNWTVR